ncbi:18S rRNA (guanine-N(7))-methyltransferase RID2-like [Cicer arietinum]|uniref:18S rRNA (Guanine-N(7))-methyltransferase RID2-like n=1 Tax=Cicer arietinum TaxID=3827 RepID=A0A1S2YMN5_CICAR|nr:18S rRNA (guanine-N(7))-methyltransferase RID2-like [Cicer arietinum]
MSWTPSSCVMRKKLPHPRLSVSGETITQNGHRWIRLDISTSMNNIALEHEVAGYFILRDMGQGLGFRLGMFDGAISISTVQWLCNADKFSHNPHLRLKAFFTSLYRCLTIGARAVFQVYPENLDQLELISKAAISAGFGGVILEDWPERYE